MTDAEVTAQATALPLIRPVLELFRSNVIAFWATTYNIDLALFNEFLLGRLGDPPLNIVVLADPERLSATLERIPPEKADQVAAINSRWLLREGPAGAERFHPKSYLTVTSTKATLLVGSGNLSTAGLDEGREVFAEFVSGTPTGDAALTAWRAWMRRLVQRVDDTRLAERFADLESKLPRVQGPRVVPEATLLHNLDVPLADQLVATGIANMPGAVEELIVTAPFFDRNGMALAGLVERLEPRKIVLYATTATSVDGAELVRRLQDSGAEVALYAYEPDRFTHAKLIAVIGRAQAWVLSGSANLSHAALTLNASLGNVELAVLNDATPEDARAIFLPPGATARQLSMGELAGLTYTSHPNGDSLPVHLMRAVGLADRRVEVLCDPSFTSEWHLDDLRSHSPLVEEGGVIRTSGPLHGRLVRVTLADGTVLSNRAVVDDPAALDAMLRIRSRSSENHPRELLPGDLDTPVGQALVWLHRNLIMDVTEAAPGGAGSGGVGTGDTDSLTDDDLWERLEREQLGRDPRVNTYARILGRPAGLGASEPILELLEAMRDRAPSLDQVALTGMSGSVLALLREQAEREAGKKGEDGEEANTVRRRWKAETRVRVRARNVLRRWAAAQNDPRLVWIDYLAPAGNFTMVATTFARLWVAIAGDPDHCELRVSDLDQLWFEWMRPFVGTGRGDGWIDAIDLTDEAVLRRLPREMSETIAALSWLALRQTGRDTTITWQPVLSAAFDRGLVEPSDEAARFLSFVTHSTVTRGRIEGDLLRCIEFIDDDLWCERTCEELGLAALQLDVGSPGQAVSVRPRVKGLTEPLVDPRLPQLIVATRRYRRCDGVAIFSDDAGWRVVIETGRPAVYLPGGGKQAMIESSVVIAVGAIEGLAANGGILADFFARGAVA